SSAPLLRLPSCLLSVPTAPTEISTLSLHDALPISGSVPGADPLHHASARDSLAPSASGGPPCVQPGHWSSQGAYLPRRNHVADRSEEHTSELQSRRDLVCRLLLEKKKQKIAKTTIL